MSLEKNAPWCKPAVEGLSKMAHGFRPLAVLTAALEPKQGAS